MRSLVPGERANVAGDLQFTVDVALTPPLALALLAFDTARRPASDWLPTTSSRPEERRGARFEADALHVDLNAIPAPVDRVVLALFLTSGAGGGIAFRALGQVTLMAGDIRFTVDLTSRPDTALVLVEIYRRAGGWRLAANGQGFVDGLPALADAYGGDVAWARAMIEPAPSANDRPAAPGQSGRSASGSGVAIDRHHILTNAHVVEGADTLSVASDGRGSIATVVFVDPRNDLALVRIDDPLPAAARLRETIEVHLGEEVVALGYPLQGLLGSGPQASAGNVAALSGIGNDCGIFQFTAPIASGNSGGPILDGAGLVIGLVSSSLNLDHVRASGSSAENVNFGIKGAVVRSFLDAYGVTPLLGRSGPVLPRAAMVREARASLYRLTVRC